jgi:hypothetical protein
MKFRQEGGGESVPGVRRGGEEEEIAGISKNKILCLYIFCTEFVCNNKTKDSGRLLFLHWMLRICSVVLSFRFSPSCFVENFCRVKKGGTEGA